MLRPKAIALSIVFSAQNEQLNKDIEKLKYLPEDIKLVVGGAGAGFYRKTIERLNGVVLSDFDSFRKFLRTLSVENKEINSI
jgi:hypothetical protein